MGRLKTIYESDPFNVSEDGWDTYDVPFDEMVEWIQHNTKLIEDILYSIRKKIAFQVFLNKIIKKLMSF